MEISAVLKEIKGEKAILETPTGETFALPSRLIDGAAVGQTVYVACSKEPARPAREIINELLDSNEPS